jgi:hypothetical protein
MGQNNEGKKLEFLGDSRRDIPFIGVFLALKFGF